MAKYKIAPTKSNLIKTKHTLRFVREGHELLVQKRDILISNMMQLVDQAADLQKKFEEILNAAYLGLKKSIIRMGQDRVARAAAGIDVDLDVTVSWRKIMGVSVPVLQGSFKEKSPHISMLDASFWFEESMFKFREALQIFLKLAQVKISLNKIAQEVKKTVRRVNALEKVSMPDLRETILYIQNVIEEAEREHFFVLKLVKRRLEAKKADA